MSIESGKGFLDFDSLEENITEDQINKASEPSTFEEPKSEDATREQNRELNPVISAITEKYNAAKRRRRSDEERWLDCYRNYRGLYDSNVQFTSTEKSQAFVKITKTKVLAAYSQVTEVLFSGSKFPIGIIPAKTGKHLASKVTVSGDPLNSGNQGSGDSKGGDPKVSRPMSRVISRDILEKTGVFKEKLESVSDNLEEGAGQKPNDVVFEPVKEAAKLMENKIQDQLAENNASKSLRQAAFELALFGHCVLKGPLGKNKEYPKWNKKGEYTPENEYIPDVTWVSIWDFYPDASARTDEEMEETIQRHRMSKSEIRSLKRAPGFRKNSIEEAISLGPNYTREYWETELEDNDVDDSATQNRWEVLEYWGYIDREMAEQFDIKIPKEYNDLDEIQANIWICNETVIRFIINPFKPQRIPYHTCPYELNPYSFFGVGVAENMFDTQLIMNGFVRLMIDNAVLSSNLVFEVDETNLVPGQDLEIHPGKVFRRQSGAPGQAVFSHKFQNVTNEAIQVFDKARQLADEATGMPSYAHGQTGVSGIGRTASGISMLMGAAAQNIKAVVRNVDDFLLVPLGRDLFAFNMQFNFREEYAIGDLEVIARGTESLMRNEIRSQKILQFLQLTANPLDAPFTKRDYLLRELSSSLDLDPEMTINDIREAKLQAIEMAKVQGPMAQQQQQGPGPQAQQRGLSSNPGPAVGGPNGVPNPEGTEGGGVNPETPQLPNEPGFSANKGL